MNTYEQRVEPRDDAKMYLVFACEPYETVAFVFPSGLRMSTADNSDPSDIQRYYCRWDATDRSYTLIFILGKELP
jgi:splicing factor 3A subunit 2